MMILHCRGEAPSLSTRILWVGGSLGEINQQTGLGHHGGGLLRKYNKIL
jgi:hypothetical protein